MTLKCIKLSFSIICMIGDFKYDINNFEHNSNLKEKDYFRCDKYILFIFYLQPTLFLAKNLFTASKETSEVVAVSALGRLFLSV